MKINLDRETIPDALYNMLLQNFVNRAIELGLDINKHSKFEDWEITCIVEQTKH